MAGLEANMDAIAVIEAASVQGGNRGNPVTDFRVIKKEGGIEPISYLTVSKKIEIDAAHFLPAYQGKCKNLHGHHWVIEVAFRGPIDKDTGMVIDFKWIKEVLEEAAGKLDHTLINDILDNPTAENMCIWLAKEIKYFWIQSPDELVQLRWIKIWETPDSMAMWEA